MKNLFLILLMATGFACAEHCPRGGTFFVDNKTGHDIQVKIKAKFESGWSFESFHPTQKIMLIVACDTAETESILFDAPCPFIILARKARSNKSFQEIWASNNKEDTNKYCGATLIVTESDGCYHAEWQNTQS